MNRRIRLRSLIGFVVIGSSCAQISQMRGEIDGLQKVEHLRFLTEGTGRTLGQVAIQYILTEPVVASVLPNIYNEQLLREFIAAVDTPALTQEELARIDQLYAENFHLEAPTTK